MARTRDVDYKGEVRKFTITGDEGAIFDLEIKNNIGKTYDWEDEIFTSPPTKLRDQEIDNSNTYENYFVIPEVTTDNRYDVYLTPAHGVALGANIPKTIKTFSIYQLGVKTLTFNTTTAISGVAVQKTGTAGADLVGGTIKGQAGATDFSTANLPTMQQIGTITKSGPTFVYINSEPTWDKRTGGNFTNLNTIETTLSAKTGVAWDLEDATNISTGHLISGEGIIDDITVSSISGNRIVVSADQTVEPGTLLRFSQGGWEIESASIKVTETSGTNTVTLTVDAAASKIGISDVTSVLNIDNFMSEKPNAFPCPDITCPAPPSSDTVVTEIESVTINLPDECTNYLGTKSDLDNNAKTFKLHSVAVIGEAQQVDSGTAAGTLKNASDDLLGADDTIADGVIIWTPAAHATMPLMKGDTVIFYYKTVDAQSTPVTSSTTQGKVTITITE